MKSPWLIVGLGNPGSKYADTYHNVGFRVVEGIANEHKVRVKEPCGRALTSGEIVLSAQSAILVLPQTYMNRSGDAMPPVFERFHSTIQDMIVVYDDLALPLGKIRLRQKGSAGGHNGIKSMVSVLGSDEFMRIRVGIQPDREIGDVRDFVLSSVAARDWEILSRSEEIAAQATETLMAEGIEKAMAAYNGIDLRVEEEKDN